MGSDARVPQAAGYRVTGLDISRQALELLDNGRRRLVLADLSQPIPSHAGTFDAVLALDVIEHIDDDQGAVERLMSLAAPGGVLMVTVPALMDLFSEFDAIQGHRRVRSRDARARLSHERYGTAASALVGRKHGASPRATAAAPTRKEGRVAVRDLQALPEVAALAGRLALDWLLRHEVGRTLAGNRRLGRRWLRSSRGRRRLPPTWPRPADDRDLGDPRTTGALHWRWRSSASLWRLSGVVHSTGPHTPPRSRRVG